MESIRKAINERNLNEGQWKDRKQWSLGVGHCRKTFWNRYIYIYFFFLIHNIPVTFWVKWVIWFLFLKIMKFIDTSISMSQTGVNEEWWMNTIWHVKHESNAGWVSELTLGESRALLPLTQQSDPTQQTSITAWHNAHTRAMPHPRVSTLRSMYSHRYVCWLSVCCCSDVCLFISRDTIKQSQLCLHEVHLIYVGHFKSSAHCTFSL
jgi:hypothetical protein